MAKCVLHVGRGKNLSPGESYENERKGWDEDAYRRKNQRPTNNYDWSRHDLNFEIVDGRVIELGSQETSLYERYQHLLEELEFKEYKAGASNQQLTYVELILSGNTDRMQQIAFGNQEVNYERNPPTWHNWDVHREKAIEEWALDNYKFVCKRYGKESVIGFEVHLDETAPHIHVNIVPVAVKKQRGNVSGYVKVDAAGIPMTYAKGKHVGEVIKLSKGKYEALSDEKKKLYRSAVRGTIRTVSYAEHFGSTRKERRMKMSQLHDEYARVVGAKWGLERGDIWNNLPEEERRKRRRRTKEEAYEEEQAKAAKERAEMERAEYVAKRDAVVEEVENLKSKVDTNQRKIKEQVASISENNSIIIKQLDAISDKKKEVRFIEEASLFHKLKHHGINPDVRRAIEEEENRHQEELARVEKRHQEDLSKARMATWDNGEPISLENGGQLTWEEYARYMEKQTKEAKDRAEKEKKAAVQQTKETEKANYVVNLRTEIQRQQDLHDKEIASIKGIHQKDLMAFYPDGRPIKWVSGEKFGHQMTKDERIKYLDDLVETYRSNYQSNKNLNDSLKLAKDLLLSTLDLNLKNTIQIILRLIKNGVKEIAEGSRNLLRDAISIVDDFEERMKYMDKAFVYARIFAAMDGFDVSEKKLKPLQEDAMRIADGTWDDYAQTQTERTKVKNASQTLVNRQKEMPHPPKRKRGRGMS